MGTVSNASAKLIGGWAAFFVFMRSRRNVSDPGLLPDGLIKQEPGNYANRVGVVSLYFYADVIRMNCPILNEDIEKGDGGISR